MNKLHSNYKRILLLFLRYLQINSIAARENIKLYVGCGANRQREYLNIDIRWTPAVDLLASLQWCSRHLREKCEEVYLSHVLEHYRYPGKLMDKNGDSVMSALDDVYNALKSDGIIRIAVPDFAAISGLYHSRNTSLFPRLSGRICGEQNYPQNVHRCVFDKEFLTFCLRETGFVDVEEWDPLSLGLERDSSFDNIDGTQTSLNLCARKK